MRKLWVLPDEVPVAWFRAAGAGWTDLGDSKGHAGRTWVWPVEAQA